MGLLEAAQSSSLIEAALLYAEHGLSVIPLKGKEPAISSWTPFQRRGASFGQIHGWDAAGRLTNVGIVCGRVSGNLVVIDCDGTEAVMAFDDRFPGLAQTYTVATGSGKGCHFYFWSAVPMHTTRVTGLEIGNIELRSDGCYVVAPPSIHPVTGNPYRVSFEKEVRRVPSLIDVQMWIEDMIREKHKMSSSAATHQPSSGDVRHTSRYGAAALAGEVDTLRRAGVGSRNNALNRAAFKLGKLIAAGKLDRASVEQSLMAVAFEIGYVNDDGEQVARRTIQSGLNAGIAKS